MSAARPGRVAVITGGGSGIGRAVALALAGRDYQLALAGRTWARLGETAGDLPAGARPPLLVACDVTSRAAVADLLKQATDRFGRVDLLFNNAGVGSSNVPLATLSEEDWQRTIATNLTGAFFCLQAAFQVMQHQQPRGGRIINNGSISAHSPRPNSIAYTASKHAVTGLTKAAALDGRPFDIAVGQIDIGNAATAMASHMAAGVPQADGSIAPEPVMDVADVGEAVAYMDSLPLAANVQFMTLMATAMPFIGRG